MKLTAGEVVGGRDRPARHGGRRGRPAADRHRPGRRRGSHREPRPPLHRLGAPADHARHRRRRSRRRRRRRPQRAVPGLGGDPARSSWSRTSTGIPTIVDNDLVAVTECENWFGTASGVDRFAVVTLGAGVGYGLVVHGQIVVDEDSGIGLVGHWPLDPLGPLCPAGHRGCAHSLLTDTAIATEVSSALGPTGQLRRGARRRRGR